MTVDNAHAFLAEMAKDGHSHDLMAKIGTEFNADHMTEALKQKGISREHLKKVAGGHFDGQDAGEVIGAELLGAGAVAGGVEAGLGTFAGASAAA